MPKRVELEDLMRYVMVSYPKLSPDASSICFMRIKNRLEENDYETNIGVVDRTTGNTTQLTASGKDTFPVWAPDSKRIAFISRRGLKDKEPGAELWVINIEGGEAQHVFTQKGGISNVRWSSDGENILFLSNVEVQKEEEEEGVRVIRGLPIYFDGAGYVYHYRKHLFVYNLSLEETKQLTEGDGDVLYAEFSTKGDQIAYVKADGPLRYFGMSVSDLYIVPTQGGVAKKVTTSNMRVGTIGWNPNDSHIAFLGTDMHRGGYTSHEKVYTISVDGQELKNLTEGRDQTTQLGVYCDVCGPYGPVQNPIWKDNYIYFLLSDRGRINLYRTSYPDGTIEEVVIEDIRIGTFDMVKDVIAFSRTSPLELTEIWVKDGTNITAMTNFNGGIKEYELSEPERFELTVEDGSMVEGWIIKPLGVEAGKKYPAILNVHGGPKSVFGYTFMHEFQYFAAQGYAVIYINPRGSGGYGEAFADIRSRYGEEGYTDLMEAVDHVLSKYPDIDADRLAITGISYGGFMTCWVIGHTDRFKVAVTQACCSNWYSFFGTADIGFRFIPDQMGSDSSAHPWVNEEATLRQSPIRYVNKVKTPCQVQYWTDDYRTPFEQSLQYYAGLQYFGVESEFVIIEGSSHGIFVLGKPKAKVAKIRHMQRWFDKYLQE